MIHKFYFETSRDNPNFDYRKNYNRVADITLHDDLVGYIGDSLKWVPSFNPARAMKPQFGLNLCGPTVLKSTGAKPLFEISKTWSALFMLAPTQVTLTGAYFMKGDLGQYEKLTYDRKTLVANFAALADLCQRVLTADDNFIIHHGL